ncbi:hypothetical protein JKP88DRAFT_251901 [Tribonema minus]|uniref:Uncharacterized protein n=1 Tax=Tribonema minus TaxID=303371 RepID=A0A836CLL3_9STRA|nr:hypothetical protein JKP88DRAFT_251901 [Tribonema minus]
MYLVYSRTLAWNVWLDGDSFDGSAEMIMCALQQHQDDHGIAKFSSASVWSQLIERGAAQLSFTRPCDRFSTVQSPATASDTGCTPCRKERGQTVDTPPPPPPQPSPSDRLINVNVHGFNDFEVSGGVLSDAYECVQPMHPSPEELLRPLVLNKHTAFDEWEGDDKAQLKTIILRLCKVVQRNKDDMGILAITLSRIHDAMYAEAQYDPLVKDVSQLCELTLPTTCYHGDENAQVHELKVVLERVIIDITAGCDPRAAEIIAAMRSLALTVAMVAGWPEAPQAMIEQEERELRCNSLEAQAAQFWFVVYKRNKQRHSQMLAVVSVLLAELQQLSAKCHWLSRRLILPDTQSRELS